jgi:hypothetical protein
MARKFSNLVTFWALQNLIQDDHTLYWHRERIPFTTDRQPDPRKRHVVRKMLVGKKHGTRAEIVYRATEYVDGADKLEKRVIHGMINADLIFAYRDELFISHASLRQLEDHLT